MTRKELGVAISAALRLCHVMADVTRLMHGCSDVACIKVKRSIKNK